MNINESSDPSILAKQFALWREAIALANAEKSARRRFAKRLGGTHNQHRSLIENTRAVRAAEFTGSQIAETERSGAQAAKAGEARWKSPFLSFFRHNQHQPIPGLIAVTQK